MKTTKLILTAIPLILCGLIATGCAQMMAIQQPRPFTPGTLVSGAKRVDIVAELGRPISSEEHSNHLADAYRYVDGGAKNSGVSKTGRVLLYTAGDIFTCWLDQVVWMPAEHFGFAGTDHSVMVDYTKSEDGFWHAARIEDKALKGRPSRSASVNSAGLLYGQTTPMVIAPSYNSTVGFNPNTYAPPTIHYTGTGVGAIQAGLMNNLGRSR